jgi:hypothetical protein
MPRGIRICTVGLTATFALSSSWKAFRGWSFPIIRAPDRACRYEPDLNRSYHEMAQHYGVAITPARPYKPRHKAKAEVGVQIVERWIVAALRHHRFHSVAEINEAIPEFEPTEDQLNNAAEMLAQAAATPFLKRYSVAASLKFGNRTSRLLTATPSMTCSIRVSMPQQWTKLRRR